MHGASEDGEGLDQDQRVPKGKTERPPSQRGAGL